MIEFLSPSDVPDHDPTKVRRSKDGRPYVKQRCPDSMGPVEQREGWDDLERRQVWTAFPNYCLGGRVPGKRPGTTKACPVCKGKGYIEKLYTRCTSFVGVLEDRTGLEKWKLRTVLVGIGVDHRLLGQLDATDPDDIDTLNRIADQAFEVGEGHEKARKGTDLHTLTEYVDKGWDLPDSLIDYETGQERPVTLQDRADLAAWLRVAHEIVGTMVDSECFVVQDDYQIGGTYDRRVILLDNWAGVSVIEPRLCYCDKPNILDLKTGRIDYGAGKMAQQLAVYANSKDYDPVTGERSDQDVCVHYGLIVHLPQGTGEASVYVVDLVAGWADVALSSKVREHRRESKHRMWPLESHAELTQ